MRRGRQPDSSVGGEGSIHLAHLAATQPPLERSHSETQLWPPSPLLEQTEPEAPPVSGISGFMGAEIHINAQIGLDLCSLHSNPLKCLSEVRQHQSERK